MIKKIVIIGGGAAGPKVAAKLRRLNPDAIIDLFTQEQFISYSACGLPYFIEGLIKDVNQLIVRTPEQFEKENIRIHLMQRCIKIVSDKKYVVIKNLDNDEENVVYYDVLVIATGARPFVPNIENLELRNVFTLRTIPDAIAIKDAMQQSQKVTIIGGGYISIELLEAFVANGLDVTVVERSKSIMSIFDPDISEIIQKHVLAKDGKQVKIINEDSVVKFEGKDGKVTKVITQKGHVFDTDMVVIATGVVPNSEITEGTNVKTGLKKSIRVNSHMRTSEIGIFAAGDCVEKIHQVTQNHCWIPLGSTANKEGRCAAINISGENCDFEGVLGSAVSRYFGFTMSMTGITEKEAANAHFDIVTATVTKKDKAGYMPGVENITIKLIVDKETREILGAQAIGCGEANQRIGTVSSAISMNTKLDDFLNIDLPYAPPYSPAIDPLLNAAQIIKDKLDKEEENRN